MQIVFICTVSKFVTTNFRTQNHMENNTWVRGYTRFISSVERDISRVSAANE